MNALYIQVFICVIVLVQGEEVAAVKDPPRDSGEFKIVGSVVSSAAVFLILGMMDLWKKGRDPSVPNCGFAVVLYLLGIWSCEAAMVLVLILKGLTPDNQSKDQEGVQEHSVPVWTTMAERLQLSFVQKNLFHSLAYAEARFATDIGDLQVWLEAPPLTPENIEEIKMVERRSDSLLGLAFYSVTFLVLSVVSSVPFAVLVIIAIAQISRRERPPRVEVRVVESEKLRATEGIYRVRQMIGPFEVSTGVAVYWKGVMHTKAHVTGDVPLLVYQDDGEMALVHPSYFNEASDLVVWGGPPKICRIGDDRRVAAVILDDSNRKHVVNSLVQESAEGEVYFSSLATKPGASGCPIFTLNKAGEIDLAGLIGVNIQGPWTFMRRNVFQVEKLVPIPVEVPVQIDLSVGSQQITMPPGSGKTRQCVPRIVEDALLQRKDVVVSAPTRVICSQMYAVLSEYCEQKEILCDIICRHKTRDLSKRVHGAMGRVTIIPHAVLARDLLITNRYRKRPTVFVIDEAHFADVKSIILVSVLRKMKEEKGVTLVELSASTRKWDEGTLDFQGDSNYHIEDVLYSNEDLEGTIKRLEGQGLKVLIFCESVYGRGLSCERVQQMIKSGTVVKFHRATYSLYADKIRTMKAPPEGLFILVTNMCECGVSPDADVVIDPMRVMSFKTNTPGVCNLEKTSDTVTVASQLQRRGRVGRHHEGVYLCPVDTEPHPRLYTINSKELLEAKLCLEAFGYRLLIGEDSGWEDCPLKVSVAQAKKFIDQETVGKTRSLCYFYITTHEDGRPRSLREMRQFIERDQSPRGFYVTFGHVTLRMHWYDSSDSALVTKLMKMCGSPQLFVKKEAASELGEALGLLATLHSDTEDELADESEDDKKDDVQENKSSWWWTPSEK